VGADLSSGAGALYRHLTARISVVCETQRNPF
jgi:hypothetical protein